jgi:signal transduction histidine kinase
MEKTLAALVAHDLKNALALLEIDLEQLNHHEGIPPEGKRAYTRCIELKNRLISFLTVYKHDSLGLKPRPVEVDLSEFIEDLVLNSQSAMTPGSHHGHQIVLRTDHGNSGVSIAFFDKNLVELALESALNNALRYAHHQVEIWFEQTADSLVFKVLDDGAGVGVVDDMMQRNVAEKSSSTGLGLALCEAVAKAHGQGFVSLESAPGGGTLFSMALRR